MIKWFEKSTARKGLKSLVNFNFSHLMQIAEKHDPNLSQMLHSLNDAIKNLPCKQFIEEQVCTLMRKIYGDVFNKNKIADVISFRNACKQYLKFTYPSVQSLIAHFSMMILATIVIVASFHGLINLTIKNWVESRVALRIINYLEFIISALTVSILGGSSWNLIKDSYQKYQQAENIIDINTEIGNQEIKVITHHRPPPSPSLNDSSNVTHSLNVPNSFNASNSLNASHSRPSLLSENPYTFLASNGICRGRERVRNFNCNFNKVKKESIEIQTDITNEDLNSIQKIFCK